MPFRDPWMADDGAAAPAHPGVMLTEELGERILSVLGENVSPGDALPVVAAELLELLLPDDESGRVSVWTLDSGSIQKMVATSARGEDGVALDDIDLAFDAGDSSFLYGLTRDDVAHGLFESKGDIEDNMIPNKPGYDQLIYAACLRGGRAVALIGAGRRFAPGGDRDRRSWREVHLASVRAVADMLETSFLRADGQDVGEGAQERFRSFPNFLSQRCTLQEQYEEVSHVLGELCKRCANCGLLGAAMWDGGDDDSWLLYPGRLTRESTADDFIETPHFSCEVVKNEFCERYLLAHVDSVTVIHGDDTRRKELLEEWMIYRGKNDNACTQSTLDRQIDLLMSVGDKSVRVEGNNAAMNSRRISKFTGVKKDDAVSVALPLLFRGDLCAILILSIDGDSAKDPANVSMILREAIVARQKMKWLSWKVQIILSTSNLPLPNLEPLISTIRSGDAVALAGAGFSIPANLMSWGSLLRVLLEKARNTNKFDEDQYDFINDLISGGTADSFDKAAQCIEDILGKNSMQEELSKLLAVNREAMPRIMQRRIKLFNDIPWRAVLTTNYDLCLEGPTPKCRDVGASYIRALRQGTRSIGEQLLQKIQTPVVKLHGCVKRGNIVFTRTGYRDLLYRVGGYQVFLQSLMASRTLVSLGHSGRDAYINDIYHELITMFGQSDLSLRYSIDPVSNGQASFSASHDGLNYITWDKDTYGWGVVDLVLLKLRRGTNIRVRMADLLRGRRILLVGSQSSNPIGWEVVELASLIYSILSSTTVHIIDDSSKLNQALLNAASEVAPYDIVLMVHDNSLVTEIESVSSTVPIGIIVSDCRGYQQGFLKLEGRVLPLVIKDMEDAMEELFLFFEKATAIHGAKHCTSRRQSVNIEPFL